MSQIAVFNGRRFKPPRSIEPGAGSALFFFALNKSLRNDVPILQSSAVEDPLDRIVDALDGARSLTVLTGAGVSAASGVPTFRGQEGLWKSYRAESLATPQAFAENPQLVWEWYQWRREKIAACRPNRAHEVIADWSHRYPEFTLITQNVDGLHERAGTSNVVRFHGSIWEVSCWNDCPSSPPKWLDETTTFEKLPPTCPHCDGPIRPGVVWFGEGIASETLEQATGALVCDVFLTVGTSSVVYPAASLSSTAKARGAFAAEINLEATAVSAQLDVSIHGAAEVVLAELHSRLVARLP